MAEEISTAPAANPKKAPGAMPGVVKILPLLAAPLALHAFVGVVAGGIGVAIAGAAIGPKGRNLLKSSGKALGEMLPVAKSAFLAATATATATANKETEKITSEAPLLIK